MNKAHENINWQDLPIRNTPLAARNLNKMDNSIDVIDDRVIVLDSDKVSKEAGKGLSSNDYTTAEKTKLAGIATGATAVSISDTLQDGDTIANITIDGTTTAIKAKQPNEQEMNVRSAMLLLSTTPISENAPFVKRVSGGNVPFPALLKDKIIGASIVWNQLVKNGNFADTSEWAVQSCTLSASNNVGICSTSASFVQASRIDANIDFVSGHKYLLLVEVNPSKSTKIRFSSNGTGRWLYDIVIPSGWNTLSAIAEETTGTVLRLYFNRDTDLGSDDTVSFRNIMLIDLTAMFGSTIADYVNTLETQTAGSGIAWLKSYGFFTEDYYAYSANTIQSVSVSAKVNKDSEDTTISTVALDHTPLRGLFKLDANNNLYADGDVYSSDGSGSVKYGIVDLGDFTWTYESNYHRFKTTPPNDAKLAPSNTTPANILCDIYEIGVASSSRATDHSIALGQNTSTGLLVYDTNYTDAQTFTTAMAGHKLCYELATPTTAILTPYPDLQNIASGGTEEFIDYQVSQGNRDVSIPVGGERQYYQGMDLPALPTASGNHNLQFNPASGFSWS